MRALKPSEVLEKAMHDEHEALSKGKALPEGTEREWGGHTYKKINGVWRNQTRQHGEPKHKGAGNVYQEHAQVSKHGKTKKADTKAKKTWTVSFQTNAKKPKDEDFFQIDVEANSQEEAFKLGRAQVRGDSGRPKIVGIQAKSTKIKSSVAKPSDKEVHAAYMSIRDEEDKLAHKLKRPEASLYLEKDRMAEARSRAAGNKPKAIKIHKERTKEEIEADEQRTAEWHTKQSMGRSSHSSKAVAKPSEIKKRKDLTNQLFDKIADLPFNEVQLDDIDLESRLKGKTTAELEAFVKDPKSVLTKEEKADLEEEDK